MLHSRRVLQVKCLTEWDKVMSSEWLQGLSCFGASGDFSWCVTTFFLCFSHRIKPIQTWGKKTQKHDHSLFIVKFFGWLCIQNHLSTEQEFVLQNSGGIFSFEQEELGVSVCVGKRGLSKPEAKRVSVTKELLSLTGGFWSPAVWK